MPSLTEGKLRFDFPDQWEATQYDSWTFYENQFADSCGGNKAVDFLAHHPQEDPLWLIEVKDYRKHRRSKSIHVWDEMAVKVRDTLAGLVAARTSGVVPDNHWAERGLKKPRLRCILHLEQPSKHSKLFPRTLDPARIQEKLRQVMKPIDPHARVTELNNMVHVPWTAASIP
jgi:hypothetical protein